MDTSVDDAFKMHTTKGVTLCGRTKDHMHAVNGCESKRVSKSEWESMFEKEGNVKENKACLTNLVAENLSYWSLHECERARIDRKVSQELGTHSASDFKAAIRVN